MSNIDINTDTLRRALDGVCVPQGIAALEHLLPQSNKENQK